MKTTSQSFLKRNTPLRFLTAIFSLIVLLGCNGLVHAQSTNIPAELKQWIPWVLYEQEANLCTLVTAQTNVHYCVWPSDLNLDVVENGAAFKQNIIVESKSLVFLPGKAPFWPEDVQDNGRDILVVKVKERPATWLTPGKHQISGIFNWHKMPNSLFVPRATARVQLTLMGTRVTDLQLDKSGQLWFKKTNKAVKSQEDTLNIQVFRKINDGVPLTQQLRIILTVSGAAREITLGLLTEETFIPLQLRSPLPIRLDEKGRMQLQVRPGQWRIELTLRNTAARSPQSLTRGTIDGPWPDEEIWVFSADSRLRQVEISGLTAVDPSRTSLPNDWKTFPAYLQQGNQQMLFTERSSVPPNATPNRLEIKRKLWLDEEGTGLTALDRITGTMRNGWRLNVDPAQTLGKVEVEGISRLITKLPGSKTVGVEVRQGDLQLVAESRIEQKVQSGQLTIPTLGWNHSFQKLSAELNLPPGWKLFTASGIDRVPTWMNHWTLLDIFLVLIISLAAGRILGIGWGTVALLTLILTYHQPGSPRLLWLPLIALLAIQKLVTANSGEKLLRVSIFLILGIIIINAIPFMVNEIRIGLYPQLGLGSHHRIVPQKDREYGQADAMQVTEDSAMKTSVSNRSGRIKTMAKSILPVSVSYNSASAPSPRPIQIDPQAMIQTGPGLPAWKWKKLLLTWNGPVRPNQKIQLFLISPFINTILAFVRVLLLGFMILGFLRGCLKQAKKLKSVSLTPALLFILVSTSLFSPFSCQTATAEIPPPEILQELQNRLLAPPKCGTNCASINFCEIQISNDLLQIRLRINTITQTALALPGNNRFFDSITLNNKEADTLRISSKGSTLIRLQPGDHQLLLSKNLQGLNQVSLPFPILPQQTTSNLQGWSIAGLRKNGALDRQITLNRIEENPERIQKENKGDLNTITMAPFVQVKRTLHMGLKWSVETTIIRKSYNNIITLEIPLLPGERVITDNLPVSENRVKINIGKGQQRFGWLSTMEPVDTLTVTAAKTSSWTEIWFLDVSPVWHVQTEGIPEVNQTDPSGMRYPEYHPYPGDTLQLNISKPEGVPGNTLTISQSGITIEQGKRAANVALSFTLTASRGLRHSITLPPDIDLQKTVLDGKEIPLQFEKNQLIIPIRPGKQRIEINWRTEGQIPAKLISPIIDLGTGSVNHSIDMNLPYSRWILLTGGPRIGPAVLFWGELLVIILFAFFLGRIQFTPLSTLQWLLLSLGLSQVPAFLGAVVIIWLLLLGLRKDRGREVVSPVTFNLMQVFLVLLTLAALIVLFFAIQKGLLGSPNMQISGNGSTNHTLHWYQDRNSSLLPTAWVITVPLVAYRISMLLWALWLAMALLRWMRWGWDCFSDTAVWKATTRKKKKQAIPVTHKNVTKKTVPVAKQPVSKGTETPRKTIPKSPPANNQIKKGAKK